jgi:hypothetical protein
MNLPVIVILLLAMAAAAVVVFFLPRAVMGRDERWADLLSEEPQRDAPGRPDLIAEEAAETQPAALTMSPDWYPPQARRRA